MTDTTETSVGDELKALTEHAPDTKIAPAHGIAAVALSMALKYHDINTVQDGTLYQQYKLEGRNMRELNLDTVFETAIRIELHLLGASERIASIVVDALKEAVLEVDEEDIEADEAEMKAAAEPDIEQEDR